MKKIYLILVVMFMLSITTSVYAETELTKEDFIKYMLGETKESLIHGTELSPQEWRDADEKYLSSTIDNSELERQVYLIQDAMQKYITEYKNIETMTIHPYNATNWVDVFSNAIANREQLIRGEDKLNTHIYIGTIALNKETSVGCEFKRTYDDKLRLQRLNAFWDLYQQGLLDTKLTNNLNFYFVDLMVNNIEACTATQYMIGREEQVMVFLPNKDCKTDSKFVIEHELGHVLDAGLMGEDKTFRDDLRALTGMEENLFKEVFADAYANYKLGVSRVKSDTSNYPDLIGNAMGSIEKMVTITDPMTPTVEINGVKTPLLEVTYNNIWVDSKKCKDTIPITFNNFVTHKGIETRVSIYKGGDRGQTTAEEELLFAGQTLQIPNEKGIYLLVIQQDGGSDIRLIFEVR